MTSPSKPLDFKGQDDSWPDPKRAWYAVSVLTVAYMCSFIDRMILNLLIVPIQEDINITDVEISLIAGFAFGIFYAVMGLPLGRLADFRNRRSIIAIGIIFWSLMTCLCGFAKNFWHLLFARIGVGVGEATLSPSAYSLISDYFPPQKLARAMSVYIIGIHIGGGLALIVGGAAVEWAITSQDINFGLGVMRPWQVAFVFVGLLGLPISLLMLTVKEPVRRNHRSPELLGSPGAPIPLKEVINYLLANRKVYLSVFITFSITSILTYGLTTWLPTLFVRIHGWSIGDIGLYFGLVLLVAGVAGTLSGGWYADWLLARGYPDAKIRVCLLGIVAFIPFGVVAPLLPTASLTLICLIPAWYFICLPMSLGASILQEITPNRMRGQISALYLLVVNILGIGVGPLVIALFTDYFFADPNSVKYSLSIVVILTTPFAILALRYGRQPLIECYRVLRAH